MWLERHLETVINGTSPEIVTLGHLNASDVCAPMDRFQIPGHDKDHALRFASQLRYLARADAETRGTLQRYAVHIVWPTEADQHPAYMAFSVDGGSIGNQELTSSTEPPTDQGTLKMVMRQNEMLFRLVTSGQVQKDADTAMREERLQGRITELEVGRMKFVELTEEMLTTQSDRTIAATQAANTEERKTKALDEVLEIAALVKPKLMAKMAGGSIGDPAKDGGATIALFRHLFEGMTIEQMKTIQATLPPDKQAGFVELYTGIMNVPEDDKPDGETAH
jgi:hypothetical protein